MPRFEAIYPVQIDNREGVSTPPWSELAARNFPNESMPGTIGAVYFDTYAQLWKGRKRPVTIFQQPIAYLWEYPDQDHKNDARTELERNQVKTVADLMRLTLDAFSSFANYREIQEKAGVYLAGLALTPHAKLLQEVYKKPQYVVPPEYEEQIVTAVNAEVDALWRSEIAVIRQAFGLEDGIVRDVYNMVLVRSGRKDVEIVDRSARGLVWDGLRHLRSDEDFDLSDYCSLPEASIGRATFVAVLYRDLPRIDGYHRDLESRLSPSACEELDQRYPYSMYSSEIQRDDSLKGVMGLDLSKHPFSPGAFEEIGKALQDIAAEQKRAREETFRVRQEFIGILDARQQPVNRLLPTIPVPEDDVLRLSTISIDQLAINTYTKNVLRENGVQTVGQILGLTTDQLRGFERLGRKGLGDLASGLQKILSLSPDIYTPDVLAELLLPPPPLPKVERTRLIVEENMEYRLGQAQAIIAEAQLHGCSTAGEIQDYLVSKRQKLVSPFTPQDWITRAIIEYVLNTLQENPPKK